MFPASSQVTLTDTSWPKEQKGFCELLVTEAERPRPRRETQTKEQPEQTGDLFDSRLETLSGLIFLS